MWCRWNGYAIIAAKIYSLSGLIPKELRDERITSRTRCCSASSAGILSLERARCHQPGDVRQLLCLRCGQPDRRPSQKPARFFRQEHRHAKCHLQFSQHHHGPDRRYHYRPDRRQTRHHDVRRAVLRGRRHYRPVRQVGDDGHRPAHIRPRGRIANCVCNHSLGQVVQGQGAVVRLRRQPDHCPAGFLSRSAFAKLGQRGLR